MHKLGMKEFDFGIYTNMKNLCIGERNKFIGATLLGYLKQPFLR